ncbi:MAG: hypothetical protein LDL33_04005 [Desulfomonile sp.]|nr:hypothetical protein [Desulfomonile sp.]
MRTKLSNACLVLLVIAVNAVALVPVIQSPYLGDDSWRESTLSGVARLTGTNLFDLSWNTVKDFTRSGRWYPLVIYYYPIFYYLDHFQYKLLILCLVLVNVLLFGWLVRTITSSTGWALAAMALSPFVLQLRFYHDPVMSYYGLMQIELALLVLSVGWFPAYLRGGGRRLLAGSIVSYTACLLIYEAFYLFWLVHVLVALIHFGWKRLRDVMRTIAPFFLITLVNGLIAVFVRAVNTVYYEGVDARFAAVDWALAFAEQVFSAVPFSYVLASDAIRNAREAAEASSVWSTLFVGALWAGVWWLVWRRARAETSVMREKSLHALVLVGLAFWVLPAPVVALSAKYQRELTWGLGYLPAYVSGFGVIMTALAGLAAISPWLRRSAARLSWAPVLGMAVVGGVLCGFNYANNRTVVERYNFVEYRPRKFIEDALATGILRAVPDRSVLVCDEPLRGWDNPAFFCQHTGLTLQVVKQPGFWFDSELGNSTITTALEGFAAREPGTYDFSAPESSGRVFSGYKVYFEGRGWPLLIPVTSPRASTADRGVFLLSYRIGTDGTGIAVLARLTALKADHNCLVAASADRVWIYVAQSGKLAEENAGVVTGSWNDGAFKSFGSFNFHERNLVMVASNGAGKLFMVPTRLMEHAIDPRSIGVSRRSNG